jgi:hypothetical protein
MNRVALRRRRSHLGQMLSRLCLEDDVPLVNIVRKPEQEDLLRAIGAVHVCNSTSPSFMDDLIEEGDLFRVGAGEGRVQLGCDALSGGLKPFRANA